MEFQEYPKALYRQGNYIAVADESEESAQRAEGFTDWHSDQAAMQGGVEPADEAAEPASSPTDRDALKARAAELGIQYPRNITTDKLAELVANA